MTRPYYSVVGNIILPSFGVDRTHISMNAHDRELVADRPIPNPPTEGATVIVLENNKIVHPSEDPPCDCG